MKQVFNPILPTYEYIPDPEPHIFGDRIYVYGSHDKFGGISFCLNDYVVYSCPIDDLTNWSAKGISYSKKEDPEYKGGILNVMFAPDCTKGLDGKYYLYYTLGFNGHISVARSDSPDGPFKFYGHVKYKDNVRLGDKKEFIQFDPAIFIDDDNKIYLYSGYGSKQKFGLHGKKTANIGAMVYELDKDMLTIKEGPNYICKTIFNSKGSDFEGHEFFEASSMRKINGTYYFIYSSYVNHELCYAYSNYPNNDFKYGGVLVSNCDGGLGNRKTNYYGNNHGSILVLNNNYYIFYHRQTNKNSFSRQMCAEKLEFDGKHFKQAELTSCGLNNGPLIAKGEYKASIACNLYSTHGTFFYKVYRPIAIRHAFLTQKRGDNSKVETQYIKNINHNTIIGYKYFKVDNDITKLSVLIKGCAKGKITVYDKENGKLLSTIKITPKMKKTWFCGDFNKNSEVTALFFKFKGIGHFSFYSFKFE